MTTVNSIQELFATLNTERQVGNRLVPQAENLNIDFELELPLDKRQIRTLFFRTAHFQKKQHSNQITTTYTSMIVPLMILMLLM